MLFLFPVTISLLLSCCLAYTDRTRPSTRSCSRPHRLHGLYMARTRPCAQSCTRPSVYMACTAVYTVLYTAAYTAVFMVAFTARVHGHYGRVRAVYTCKRSVYMTVYTACTRSCTRLCTLPCKRLVHGRVHGPYMAVYTGRVHKRPCTRAVYVHGRADGLYTVV